MDHVHAIENLNFNFSFESAKGVEALEFKFRDFSVTRAPAVIADVFDSYFGDDDIVQVDRLDVELVPPPTTETEFEDSLRTALDAALKNLLTTNGGLVRSSRVDTDIAQLWKMLGRGYGGWRSAGNEPAAIDSLVDRVLASSGKEIAARFAATPDRSARLARVAAQWSASQQAKLAVLLDSIATQQPEKHAIAKTRMADQVAHVLPLLRAESNLGQADPTIANILINETLIVALCDADDRISLIDTISRHWPSKQLWQIWLLVGLSASQKPLGSDLPALESVGPTQVVELVDRAGSMALDEVRTRLAGLLDSFGKQFIQMLASKDDRAERLAHLVDAATPYQRMQMARHLSLISPGAGSTRKTDGDHAALPSRDQWSRRSARATAVWNARLVEASAPRLPWWLSEWARARPGSEAIGRLAIESAAFVREQLAGFDHDPNWRISLASNSNSALWAALLGTMVVSTEAALLVALLDTNETKAIASRGAVLALLLDSEPEIVTATAIATAIVYAASTAIGDDPAQAAARIVAEWPAASSAAVASLLSPVFGTIPQRADRSQPASRSAIVAAFSRGIWPAALVAELYEDDPIWLAEQLRRIGVDARWRAQVAAQLDTTAMALLVGLWVAAADVAPLIEIADTLAGHRPGVDAAAGVRYALLTAVLLNDAPRPAAVDVADRLVAVLAREGVLDPAMLVRSIVPGAAVEASGQLSHRPATPLGAEATVSATALAAKLRGRLATSAEAKGERHVDRYNSPLADAILRRQLGDSISRATLVERVSEGECRALLLRLAPLSGSAALKQVDRLSGIADAIGWPVPTGASIRWDVLFSVVFGDQGGYDSIRLDRSWRTAWIATVPPTERPAVGVAFDAAAGSSSPTWPATPDALGSLPGSLAVPGSTIGGNSITPAPPPTAADRLPSSETVESYAVPASSENGGRLTAAAEPSIPTLATTPVASDVPGLVVGSLAVPGSTIGDNATQPLTDADRSPTSGTIESHAAPASISLGIRNEMQRPSESPLAAQESGGRDDGAMRPSGTLAKTESASSLSTPDATQRSPSTVSANGDVAFDQTKPGSDSGSSMRNIEEALAAGRFSAALIASLQVPLTYPLRQALLAGLAPARVGVERLLALDDKDRRRLLALLVPQEAAEVLALVTGLEQLWYAARLPAGDRPDDHVIWQVLLRFFVDHGRSFDPEAFASLWLAARAAAKGVDGAALSALWAPEVVNANAVVNTILQRTLHRAAIARPPVSDAAVDVRVPPAVMAHNEVIAIDNAGLVLVAPYLPMLFSRLKLVEENRFIDVSSQVRAAQLLAVLVDGEGNAPESRLVLNKLLVGLDLATPLARGVVASDTELAMIEGLLQAVIERWAKLGSTTVAGLRESFLRRPGILMLADAGGDGSDDVKVWRLRVEERAYDVLVDLIPWGFRTVRLPWMPRMINVEWR